MSGIEAGKAYVKFLLDDGALKKGLQGIAAKLNRVGSIGAAVSGPIVAGFAACVTKFMSTGAALDDLSKRTGISGGALSELSYAANQSGTSIETVAAGVAKMQKSIAAAGEGTGTFGRTLATLGVDLNELQSLNPEQQFTLLADAISRIQDPTQRAAMAQRVFGGSARELLPLLADGAAGLANLRKEGVATGAAMSSEQVESAGALDDSFTKLKDAVSGLAEQIGAALSKECKEWFDWATKIVTKTTEWVKENPKLVATIAKVAGALALASIAALGLGAALTLVTLHPFVALAALIAAGVVAICLAFDNWHDRIIALLGPLAGLVQLTEYLFGLKPEKNGGATGSWGDPASGDPFALKAEAEKIAADAKEMQASAVGQTAAIAAAKLDGEALQKQITANLPQGVAVPPASSADMRIALDNLDKKTFAEIAFYTKSTAEILQRMASARKDGGFFVGSG